MQSAECRLQRGISTGLVGGEGLPRRRRLVSAVELRRILEGSQRQRLGHLDLYWMDNSAGHPRMGLIVPKFQSTGVARNRLRRRIREIWRREVQQTVGPFDVVIRARPTAYQAAYRTLRKQLLQWRDALAK